MNDLNAADCFDESDFEAEEDTELDPFDAEFDRIEREEAEAADRAIDDDATGDYEE